MGNLGIGAMLHILGGGSEHSSDEYYGKTIKSAVLDKEHNKFLMEFTDGVKIAIWDSGQSCCESRYITTDDKPADLIGHVLAGINVKDGPDFEDEWGECHEQVFVEISTNEWFITLVNHNEHNGYYGGFGLTITEEG